MLCASAEDVCDKDVAAEFKHDSERSKFSNTKLPLLLRLVHVLTTAPPPTYKLV